MTITAEPLIVVVVMFLTRSDLAMKLDTSVCFSHPRKRWGSPVPLYKLKMTDS
jgi:hypothetical protein